MPKAKERYEVELGFSADTSKVKTQIEELKSSLRDFSTGLSMEAPSKGIEKAKQSALDLQVALNKAFNADTGKFDLGDFRKSLRASNTDLKTLQQNLGQAGNDGYTQFNRVAAAIVEAEIPARRINKLFTSMGTTLMNTVKWQISSSLLHNFMGSVQEAYRYVQDLNESLNNIRIVTGSNVDEMAKFAEQANKAAKSLSTTTNEYAKASLIYFQQGLNKEEVAARTDVTVKMANVTRQSAQEVSDQMTAIWNNFSKGSDDLESFSDKMVNLGAKTASSASEIAGGLEKFAAVANTVNLSFDYAAAALATITAKTRQSEDVVGTSLKTIFARMESLKLGEDLDDGTTLGQYAEALDKVGVKIRDASGELKAMDQILDETGAVWQNLSKAQQVALAQSVAGIRQYAQFIALMDNYDFMQQNVQAARNSEGALQRQQDIYAESWEAAQNRVKAAAESVYSTLLDDKFFIKLSNNLAKLIEGFDKFVKAIGGLKTLIPVLSTLMMSLYKPKIVSGLSQFGDTISRELGIEKFQSMELKSEAAASIKNGSYTNAQEISLNEHLENRVALQQQINLESDKWTETEKETAKVLMEQYKNLSGIAEQKAKISETTITDYQKTKMELGLTIPDMKEKGIDKAFQKIEKFEQDIKNSNGNLTNPNRYEKRWLSQISDEAKKNPKGMQGYIDSGEFDTSVDQRIIQLLTQEGKVSEDTARKFVAARREARKANEDFTHSEERVGEAAENARKKFDSFGKQPIGFSEWITSAGMALTSLISMVNSLKGAWDTLFDSDMSAGEKFLAIFQSLALTLTMLPMMVKNLALVFKKANAEQALNTVLTGLNTLARKKNAEATKQQTQASGEHAAAQTGESASTAGSTAAEAAKNIKNPAGGVGAKASLGALFKGALPALGSIAAIIGGIAIIAASVATYEYFFQRTRKEAEAAQEAVKKYAETARKAKEEYNSLISSKNSYEENLKSINNLTKGTVEYQEALLNANEAAIELLSTYKNLEYEINKEGIIEFKNLEEVQQQELEKRRAASVAYLVAQSDAQKKELKADREDYEKKLSSREANYGAIGTGVAAGGGGALAATGVLAMAGLLASNPAGWIIAAAGAITAIVVTAVEASRGQATSKEDQAFEKAKDWYKNNSESFASAVAKAQSGDLTDIKKILQKEVKISDSNIIQAMAENSQDLIDAIRNETREENDQFQRYKSIFMEQGYDELAASDLARMFLSKKGEEYITAATNEKQQLFDTGGSENFWKSWLALTKNEKAGAITSKIGETYGQQYAITNQWGDEVVLKIKNAEGAWEKSGTLSTKDEVDKYISLKALEIFQQAEEANIIANTSYLNQKDLKDILLENHQDSLDNFKKYENIITTLINDYSNDAGKGKISSFYGLTDEDVSLLANKKNNNELISSIISYYEETGKNLAEKIDNSSMSLDQKDYLKILSEEKKIILANELLQNYNNIAKENGIELANQYFLAMQQIFYRSEDEIGKELKAQLAAIDFTSDTLAYDLSKVLDDLDPKFKLLINNLFNIVKQMPSTLSAMHEYLLALNSLKPGDTVSEKEKNDFIRTSGGMLKESDFERQIDGSYKVSQVFGVTTKNRRSEISAEYIERLKQEQAKIENDENKYIKLKQQETDILILEQEKESKLANHIYSSIPSNPTGDPRKGKKLVVQDGPFMAWRLAQESYQGWLFDPKLFLNESRKHWESIPYTNNGALQKAKNQLDAQYDQYLSQSSEYSQISRKGSVQEELKSYDDLENRKTQNVQEIKDSALIVNDESFIQNIAWYKEQLGEDFISTLNSRFAEDYMSILWATALANDGEKNTYGSKEKFEKYRRQLTERNTVKSTNLGSEAQDYIKAKKSGDTIKIQQLFGEVAKDLKEIYDIDINKSTLIEYPDLIDKIGKAADGSAASLDQVYAMLLSIKLLEFNEKNRKLPDSFSFDKKYYQAPLKQSNWLNEEEKERLKPYLMAATAKPIFIEEENIQDLLKANTANLEKFNYAYDENTNKLAYTRPTNPFDLPDKDSSVKKLERFSDWLTGWENQISVISAQLDKIKVLADKLLTSTFKGARNIYNLLIQQSIELQKQKNELIQGEINTIKNSKIPANKAILDASGYNFQYDPQTGIIINRREIEQKMIAQKNSGILSDEQLNDIEDVQNAMNEYDQGQIELLQKEKDIISNLISLTDEIQKSLSAGLNQDIETIDNYLELIQSSTSLITTYSSTISDILIKTTNDSSALQKMTNNIITLQKKSIDFSTQTLGLQKAEISNLQSILQQYTKLYSQVDDEQKEFLKKEIDDLEKKINEKVQSLHTSLKEIAEAAVEVFKFQFEEMLKQTQASLTKYATFEQFKEAMNWNKEVSNNYLSDMKKAYEFSKLSRAIQVEISKNNSVMAQGKLRDVLKEINKYQEENKKISKAELDMLNARYQVRLAEIQLEEAQNNMTQMRLTRDAGGNWSYIYTANEDEIAKAQQNLEDKQNSLLESMEKNLQDYANNIISTEEKYYSLINSIGEKMQKGNYSEKERKQDYAMVDNYLTQLKYYENQINKLTGSGYSIQTLANNIGLDINTILESSQNLAKNNDEVLGRTEELYMSYSKIIQDAAEAAGVKVDDMGKSFVTQANNIETTMIKSVNNVNNAIRLMLVNFSLSIDDIKTKLQELKTLGDEINRTAAGTSNAKSKNTAVKILMNAAADPGKASIKDALEVLKAGQEFSFATGGYTGEWGPDGKLAVLHEKELVLNKDDTSNMLAAIQALRALVPDLAKIIDQNSARLLPNIALPFGMLGSVAEVPHNFDQSVQINANFPNVSSANEIEIALKDLANQAAQYASKIF